MRIWDPSTGRKLTQFHGHTDIVQGVAWSPDGTRIASGDTEGTILIHDSAPGRAAEEKQKRLEFQQAEIGKQPAAPPR